MTKPTEPSAEGSCAMQREYLVGLVADSVSMEGGKDNWEQAEALIHRFEATVRAEERREILIDEAKHICSYCHGGEQIQLIDGVYFHMAGRYMCPAQRYHKLLADAIRAAEEPDT